MDDKILTTSLGNLIRCIRSGHGSGANRYHFGADGVHTMQQNQADKGPVSVPNRVQIRAGCFVTAEIEHEDQESWISQKPI